MLAAPAPPAEPTATPPISISQRGSYDDQKAGASMVHREGLEELANWCQKNKAFLQRDDVYKTIIEIVPDHANARKFLKYSFDKKAKAWVRKRPYRAPKSGKEDVVAEYETRLAALDDALVKATLDLIKKFEDKLGPAKRGAELRELLKAAPNNARIRELLGYVAVEDGKGKLRWTTRVIVETEERRAATAKALTKVQESVPDPKAGEALKAEKDLDIDWAGVRGTERVRVLANTNVDEADAVAKMSHASWSFLPGLVGGKSRTPKGFTIYLIEGETDRSTFIDTYPGYSDADREMNRRLESAWIPNTRGIACWSGNVKTRIDHACKQTTLFFLNANFGITTKRGWLVEGIGLYVNQMVLGTRLCRHVTKSEYVDQTEPRYDFDLQDADADWMTIAGDYLDDVKPTRLAGTLGRNTSEMSPEDVVLAYALVAYICEGHGPKAMETILRRVGRGDASSVVALEELLKMTLPEIQTSLNDWLDEVGGHDF